VFHFIWEWQLYSLYCGFTEVISVRITIWRLCCGLARVYNVILVFKCCIFCGSRSNFTSFIILCACRRGLVCCRPRTRRENIFSRVCLCVCPVRSLTSESIDLESRNFISGLQVQLRNTCQGRVSRSRGQCQGHASEAKYTRRGDLPSTERQSCLFLNSAAYINVNEVVHMDPLAAGFMTITTLTIGYFCRQTGLHLIYFIFYILLRH